MKDDCFPGIEFLPFCHTQISLGYYQENCRIYLDEHPEQEKARAIYFCQDTWRSLMKRFMVKE